MLTGIRALDFGAWGRSLKIGERYAQILLKDNHTRDEAGRISERLVYSYTHHLFPIDYREARAIGLPAGLMSDRAYHAGLEVVEKCKNNGFIGFVSPRELESLERTQAAERAAGSGEAPPGTAGTSDQDGHGAPAQPQSAMADTSGQYIDNPEDYRR
jgi:hypothetical protein